VKPKYDDEHRSSSPIPPSTPWESSLNKTDWSHYTTTQTIVFSAITTVTTLALIQAYKKYVRRVPSVAYLKPGYFRSRSLYGYVTRVGDGDGFHLFHTPGGRFMGWGWIPGRRGKDMMQRAKTRGEHNTIPVRIAGIDAPEIAHFGKPGQPYAEEAMEGLKKAIFERYVRVYPLRQDQYNRAVSMVYRRQSFLFRSDVGLQMLKQGLATVYEAKVFSEFGGKEEVYRKAEKKAKKRKVGIWGHQGWLDWFFGKNRDTETPRQFKKRMAQEDKNDKTADMVK
jgi:endonuclease YncB( thermonuclease family)